ncbi:ORF-83 [Catopsilia pomona nucleopolyhedrovirus]|uniref:ORF-83 n=1 Tax=Catopsilia pomona nucleopolyhedrovirus TaxID=1850906 RepID=A0A172WZF6_9ABAC|nr:ORF-83 [Catopsilia pomona nucleopolyhedrovirus]ANF29731.1 ORF-83 [Catopsilia pomona nucleopolyhedrovirus]
MIQSVYAKYLEFDGVVLDLRNVIIEQDCNDSDDKNENYIIFMNIKKAIYKNFCLRCNMSLETLTVYIFEQLRLIKRHEEFIKPANFVDCISFNETDNDNSMIVDLCPDARIIVAKQIYSGETYHQRVHGFLDFQNRNCVPRPTIIVDQTVRDKMDRELEMKLYQL